MPSDYGWPIVELDLLVTADVALPDDLSGDTLEWLARYALACENQEGTWAIDLLFTSDDAIQGMHLQYMGLDSPTDIMTFPFVADEFAPMEEFVAGGDIVISVETAEEHAADAGWSLREELEFLLLHGILHILGWDDANIEQRASMLARQDEILSSWRERKAHES